MGGAGPAKAASLASMKQDWVRIAAELNEQGWAILPGLMDDASCDHIAGLYDHNETFRSRVVMARHGFGKGEYRYFAYPLPGTIEKLRTALYPPLAQIANGWQQRLDQEAHFPDDHAAYLTHCHAQGQA